MGYYINKKIFDGAGREEPGIWALIGMPSNLDGVETQQQIPSGYCFIKNMSTNNIIDKLQFKDICIAGLASTEAGIISVDEGRGNVKIKYPQSENSKILIEVNSDEANSVGFGAAYLVYVSLKKDENGNYKFYTQDDENYDLINRVEDIYLRLWNGKQNNLNVDMGYTENTCKIFEDYFEEILLAYDLEALNGSLVNGYNYTGFSVGSATISLSGLDSIF